MSILNVYKDSASKSKKGCPILYIKNTKMQPHSCNINYINGYVSHLGKIGTLFGTHRILPTCSFFAAFAALREISVVFGKISRKAAKNAKAKKSQDRQRLSQRPEIKVVDRVRSPQVSKGKLEHHPSQWTPRIRFIETFSLLGVALTNVRATDTNHEHERVGFSSVGFSCILFN